MLVLNFLQKIAVYALPLIFAITVHETAHGWVASQLGDKTAKMMGRLTLNPLKHIDWLGTILVPLLMIWLGGFIFGWAKPVPINHYNLRNQRRDLALISIAGPVSNLLMALFWAVVMKIGISFYDSGVQYLALLIVMGSAGIQLNLMLAVVNLIPIPPLDGGHFLSNLLPPRAAYYYDQLEHYGLLIMVVLISSRLLNVIIPPVIIHLYKLLVVLFRM